MELVQSMLREAQEYKNEGNTQASLERYSDTFNLLVAQAAEFARSETGNITDENALRAIAPLLLTYSKEYLVQDLTAASILNAMGILFEEMGDFENAKQKYNEAIEYTPVGISYDDPVQNLESISNRVIQTAQFEEDDE